MIVGHSPAIVMLHVKRQHLQALTAKQSRTTEKYHALLSPPCHFLEKHDRLLAQRSPGESSKRLRNQGHRRHLVVAPVRPEHRRSARSFPEEIRVGQAAVVLAAADAVEAKIDRRCGGARGS